jgi:hypothetical protein
MEEERFADPEVIEAAKEQTQSAEEIRDERIAELESQLARLMAANGQPEISEEERLKRFNDPYDNAHDYGYVLALATGELVGHDNPHSTRHWSRALSKDVPVRDVFRTEED